MHVHDNEVLGQNFRSTSFIARTGVISIDYKFMRAEEKPFAIGGTCHQVREVAQIAAASVRTMGVPRHPIPPYILECESDATTSV